MDANRKALLKEIARNNRTIESAHSGNGFSWFAVLIAFVLIFSAVVYFVH